MANSHPEHPPKLVHFKVDNERFSTDQPVQTPDNIIQTYGEKDAATNYLVRIHGHDTESFRDKGTIPITIENGDRFQIVSVGPTPVSDPHVKSGASAFIGGLRELGIEAQLHATRPGAISFAYAVETGKFAGKTYEIALDVPEDFPMTSPSGPHVRPQVVPLNPGAPGHPERAHESHFGSDWQYWSRPFQDWARSPTVKAYMAHIFRLWHTQ